MYSQGIHYHYEQNSFVPVHKNLNKRMKLYLTEFFLSSTISFLGKGKLFSVASAANFLPQDFSPQPIKTAQTQVKHLIPLNWKSFSPFLTLFDLSKL